MELFVLFSCDEWKSSDSMGLVGVYDEKGLRKALKQLLKKKDVEVMNNENIDEIEVEDLNKYVTYAYIEEVELNSLQNV